MSHPRSVRRGNTSGLIGLWNQKAVEQENSGSVTNESLKIREAASRRISVRDPPKLSVLETSPPQRLFSNTLTPNANAGDVPRFRKTSEIVRPTFKIKEETEGEGVFASGILKEKKTSKMEGFPEDQEERSSMIGRAIVRPAFSFISGEAALDAAFNDQEQPVSDEPDAIDYTDDILKNKELQKIICREKRRGSKTTDDIKEDLDELERKKNGPGKIGRSKSVRLQRVKFGLIPADAQEGRS